MIEVTLHEAEVSVVPIDNLAVLRFAAATTVFNILLSMEDVRKLITELSLLSMLPA